MGVSYSTKTLPSVCPIKLLAPVRDTLSAVRVSVDATVGM
jgi:hypothetical protein